MLTRRTYWYAIGAANATGAVLVFIGANASAALQLIGLVLLAPGSLVAALLPLHRLWRPVLWKCCQIDATGFSNLVYLPVAIVTNLLVWWIVQNRLLRWPSRVPDSAAQEPRL